MEVKPGYKQTEVGVIPDEWDVKPMREFGKFAKGIGLLKEDIRSSGLIPGIPYTALYTDFSEIVNYEQIKWFIDDPTKTYLVSEPCLLIASSSNMAANTGKACALTGTASVAIGREVIVFKTPENCCFLSYLLSTPTYRKQTLILARGTTIKHLYPATFQDYKIALPPPTEQNSIAAALSDVDGLLGGLDRLIAKKRDLKQAAMQQLLTGQTRLPGFHGEWKPKRFSELLKYERPDKFLVKSAEYLEQGDTPVLTANKSFILGYTNDEFGIYQNLPAIIFDDFTTDSKYVDFPFKVKSSAIKILKARSPEVNLRFIFSRMQLVNFPLGEHKRYYISEYQHIELPTPEPDEQTDIAEVLTDMDVELLALVQRREKIRALKQAMMQELLTGRTRLILPEEAHA